MSQIPIHFAEENNKMGTYNALDALNTLMISRQLLPAISSDPEYSMMYDYTMRLYEPLMYMMSRGMLVNQVELEKTKVEVGTQIDELRAEINEIAGYDINPASPKQMVDYFYVQKKIPAYTKRNTNGESVMTCDDMALTRLARGTSSRKGLKEAKLIQKWRALSKLKGTYLDINFDTDSRMRCQYKPRGTKFSRLSSAITYWETGMNMQNLPTEFKGFLQADPGYILIELDKRQAEWIVVAYLANEENMINVIKREGDAHAHTAIQFFMAMGYELPLDVLYEEHKLGEHSTDPESLAEIRGGIDFFKGYKGWLPRNMTIRQMGKKSNHGLNYRERAKGFALINEMLEADGKRCVELYDTVYPGVDSWHERVKQQLLTDRTIHDLCGRKYRFMDKYDPGEALLRRAISYSPQSTVGHITGNGLIGAYESKSNYMNDLELLGQVHDSVLFQYPIANLSNMAKACIEVKHILEPTLTAHGNKFIIPTDMKMGYIWKGMVDVDLDDNITTMTRYIEEGVSNLEQEKSK